MSEYSPSQIKAARFLKWLDLLIPLALTSYWGLTFSGLYALIAKAQLHLFDAYAGVITWLIAMIVLLIPAHIAIRFVAIRMGLPFDAVQIDSGDTAIRARKFVVGHFFAILGFGFVAGGLIAGSYFLVDGYLAGSVALAEVPVERLSADPNVTFIYIDLIGKPLREEPYLLVQKASALSSSGPGPDYYYFPMVPPNWKQGDAVHVIVKSFYEQPTTLNGSAGHPDRLRGILRRRVPSLVLEEMKNTVKIDSPVWLLDETRDPESDRTLGTMLIAGMPAFGFLLIGLARVFRKKTPG